MAGIIWLVGFFLFGGGLLWMTHRALVVSAHPEYRALCHERLQAHGIDCLRAASAAEALEGMRHAPCRHPPRCACTVPEA